MYRLLIADDEESIREGVAGFVRQSCPAWEVAALAQDGREALVISFMDMQTIMVLTEGGPMGKTNVMFLYIYQLFFPISAGSTVTQEFGYGAAVSLVAACIIGLITGLYLLIGSRLDKVTGE